MLIDDDLDLVFSRAMNGKQSLSEEELTAFDPLREDYLSKDGQQFVSIEDALLSLREDLFKMLRDGERISRFSPEYTFISKLIRNNVTVLGQGLMTLHKEGFDLSNYALNLHELRCIASFHFRKNRDGAMVALKTNQKVFIRCMGEELEWAKLIIRLEISEHKLAQPVKAIPAPKTAVEVKAANPASGAIAEVQSFQPAAALPPMRALPELPASKKQQLLSARQEPESKPKAAEKTAKTEAAKAHGSSHALPYRLSAYAKSQSEAAFPEKKRTDPRPPRPPG